MKLAIISHTEHYVKDGQIVGWGPTVREINELLELFDEIWHIAPLYDYPAPQSSYQYISKKIHFVPLRPTGGENIFQKFSILWNAPKTLNIVNKILQKVDYWHFRAPTGIGVYLIPYLSHFVEKPGWFKYAGNWIEKKAPLSYKFQKFWLSKINKKKVTINGKWLNQPGHCISFENPCLYNVPKNLPTKPSMENGFNLCFIGSLTDKKGLPEIIKIINNDLIYSKINKFYIIGDGKKRTEYEQSIKHRDKVFFTGYLNKRDIDVILEKCHFIIMPSSTEGFPKVIAEAAAFGTIPIVSNVSCISQYISDERGFLWNIGETAFSEVVLKALSSSKEVLEVMSKKIREISNLFTYKEYLKRIKTVILEIQ